MHSLSLRQPVHKCPCLCNLHLSYHFLASVCLSVCLFVHAEAICQESPPPHRQSQADLPPKSVAYYAVHNQIVHHLTASGIYVNYQWSSAYIRFNALPIKPKADSFWPLTLHLHCVHIVEHTSNPLKQELSLCVSVSVSSFKLL